MIFNDFSEGRMKIDKYMKMVHEEAMIGEGILNDEYSKALYSLL